MVISAGGATEHAGADEETDVMAAVRLMQRRDAAVQQSLPVGSTDEGDVARMTMSQERGLHAIHRPLMESLQNMRSPAEISSPPARSSFDVPLACFPRRSVISQAELPLP